MKKSSAKWLSTVICGAMIASLASCATGVTYPLTIDGEKIRAGIYIMQQQNALYEATSKLSEEQPDLDTSAEGFDYTKQTIEGISFSDWVNKKAVEKCREYVAVNKLFDQNGLTLDSDTVKNINSQTNSLWTEENMYAQYFYGVDIMGKYYENLGIGQQSYKDVMTEESKHSVLFDYYYGENGTEAVSDIDALLTDKYAAVNYFEYTIDIGEGPEAYAEMLNNGESFESVYQKHKTNEEKLKLTEEKNEAEENGEEYTGEDPADFTAELPETDSLINVLKADDTKPSAEFVAEVFAMNAGENKVITIPAENEEDRPTYYIVSKVNILEKTALADEYRNKIRHELKDDEFEAKIKTAGDAYSVTEDGSKAMYTVDKLL